MIEIADRVAETTTTAGNGTVDLAGAAVAHQTFVLGVGDGAEVYYTIVGQAGGGAEGEWEVGIGTVTDAAPDTLSRDTVLSSSNGGALVVFSAGTKDVFLTLPAKAPVIYQETVEPAAVANVDLIFGDSEVYRIVGWLAPATDNQAFWVRFSNDGGATFRSGASDYSWGQHYHNLGSPSTGYNRDITDSKIIFAGSVGNAAGEQIGIDILVQQAHETRRTTIMGQCSSRNSSGHLVHTQVIGVVATAEDNDAIRFLFAAGNIASGRLVMYGYPAGS